MVSLSIEHWDDITTQSIPHSPQIRYRNPIAMREVFHSVAGTDDQSNKAKALYLAIDFNLVRAAGHLLAIGAGIDHASETAVDGGVAAYDIAYATAYDTAKDCYSCPLGYAASLGNSSMYGLLLKSGAAVNGPGDKVEPPLHCAIRCQKGRSLVPLLIEAGADLKISFKNVRPLALAILHTGAVSRESMVELLLENGAGPTKSSLIGLV